MIFKVFHLNDDAFRREQMRLGDNAQPAAWPEDFDLVAVVMAAGLNQVYRDTNHIDRDWTENASILRRNPAVSPRSTSVGDVILNDKDGTLHRVARVGFETFDA